MVVLVDESSAGGVASDWLDLADCGYVASVVGCALVEAAVGSVRVVVLDVLVEKAP